MLSGFLLALREGVEAALVIGIVLGVLRKLNRPDLRPAVWLGTGLAGLACLGLAVGLRLIGSELEGQAEAIFEGISIWLAAGILTWMIFWMQRQSRAHSRELEQHMRSVAARQGRWPFFAAAFLAVFREGVELALFLVAAGLAEGAAQTLLGASLGLVVAAGLGWLLFSSTRRLPLGAFFKVTNVLLILFAAGLFAHGMQAFNEAALIPTVVDHVYNLNPILNESSLIGQVLKALFGYSSAPSLSEMLAYFIYFGVLLVGIVWIYRSQRVKAPAGS